MKPIKKGFISKNMNETQILSGSSVAQLNCVLSLPINLEWNEWIIYWSVKDKFDWEVWI